MNSASADTDNVDLQCGDQNTPDVGSAPGQKTLGASSDTGGNTDQQVGDQSGDQNSLDTGGQTP